MVPWIGVQLTWEEGMFVCLKPVAGVIVAPRWASYSHHVAISDPSNSTNQQIIFLSQLAVISQVQTLQLSSNTTQCTIRCPKKEPK
jgi:hypothetical protein